MLFDLCFTFLLIVTLGGHTVTLGMVTPDIGRVWTVVETWLSVQLLTEMLIMM